MSETPNASLIASDIVRRLQPGNGDSVINNERLTAGLIQEALEQAKQAATVEASKHSAKVFHSVIIGGLLAIVVLIALVSFFKG